MQVPLSVSFQLYEETAGGRQMLKGDPGLPDHDKILLIKRQETKGAPPSTQKGQKGEIGRPGISGVPGIQGEIGAQGLKGSIGPFRAGIQGPKGEKGRRGLQGMIGPQGLPGPIASPVMILRETPQNIGNDPGLQVPPSECMHALQSSKPIGFFCSCCIRDNCYLCVHIWGNDHYANREDSAVSIREYYHHAGSIIDICNRSLQAKCCEQPNIKCNKPAEETDENKFTLKIKATTNYKNSKKDATTQTSANQTAETAIEENYVSRSEDQSTVATDCISTAT